MMVIPIVVGALERKTEGIVNQEKKRDNKDHCLEYIEESSVVYS